MSTINLLDNIKHDSLFSKEDCYKLFLKYGYKKTFGTFLVEFQEYIRKGFVQRTGKNVYCLSNDKSIYSYDYSKTAQEIALNILKKYPNLNFVIFETIQLNEFVNHMIGNNMILVFVDKDSIDFVFDFLKDKYDSVLLMPNCKELYRYGKNNSIILTRLISESPINKKIKWQATIEKLMVDLLSEQTILESVPNLELGRIYDGIFEKYVVDKNTLYRYARRRNAKDKLEKYLENNH